MSQRDTGETTRQMKAAPKDAIYVCPGVGALFYSRNLAASLGRSDLKMVTLEAAEHNAIGTRRRIVVDHAVRPYTVKERERLDWIDQFNRSLP